MNTRTKPGPKPSGVERSEIERKSSQKHRSLQHEAGLVDLRCFVLPESREWLRKKKVQLGVDTLGEVIDHLVRSESSSN